MKVSGLSDRKHRFFYLTFSLSLEPWYMCYIHVDLGLAVALVVFKVFKGQTADAIYEMLEKNHFFVVEVPTNCTTDGQ